MASPGQQRRVCGHAMVGFDQHAHCARFWGKKKGTDPCGKGNFYCVNTSYPMDNCFTGWRDRSRQMPEKDVLYIIP